VNENPYQSSRRTFLKAGVGAAASLACMHTSASEPTDALTKLCSGHKVKATIGRASSGKVMLLLDGRPQPLFWASLGGSSPDYRRAGMNTVFFELTYPGKDKPLDDAMRAWDEGLLKVKEQGLWVILYIHNSFHQSAGEAPSAWDQPWREAVQAIVRRYRGITNLVGWNFSDEPCDNMTYPREGFQRFLQREYASLDELNRTWNTHYADWSDIALEYEREGHGRPEASMEQKQFPFGVGPKAFDSARFKAFRVTESHRAFADAVRAVDPDTPLWSGAQNLAWGVAQLPHDWGVYCDLYPQFSGNDFETHHIWVMDAARGPNLRPAMQMLLPEHPERFDWHLDPRVLRGWMVESALHGAAGITVWPWSFLGVDNRPGDRSTSVERIDMCRTTFDTLQQSGIFEMRPTNTVGVIYQPYAEGWGAASQVYGLLRRPDEEPCVLMEQLRFGTRFGQVDYLRDLGIEPSDLDAYGVLLAQFAPEWSEDDLQKLTAYVRRGGIILADIGFDCLRAGKTIASMSDSAKALFGIRELRVSDAGQGSFAATGDFAELLGGLEKGKDATDKLFQFALDVETTTAVAASHGPGKQGLYVNPVGDGFAIFISALAWSRWTVQDPLFRKIHNALFARRARIERLGEDDWTRVSSDRSLAPGYEVARFVSGYALQNRTDAAATLSVRVDGEPRRHEMEPRSVLLVNQGREIRLGTGVYPRNT
jgi:hypothetical protein